MPKKQLFFAFLLVLFFLDSKASDYQGQKIPFELLERDFSEEYQFADPFPFIEQKENLFLPNSRTSRTKAAAAPESKESSAKI